MHLDFKRKVLFLYMQAIIKDIDNDEISCILLNLTEDDVEFTKIFRKYLTKIVKKKKFFLKKYKVNIFKVSKKNSYIEYNDKTDTGGLFKKKK